MFTKSNRKEDKKSSTLKRLSTSSLSRGSRLRSNDDDDSSIVRRPIHHINNVCYCYENPDDCTTCSEDTSRSDRSDIFELDESESELRLTCGSTLTVTDSSDDGSSLFGEEFSKKLEENLKYNEQQEQIYRKDYQNVLNIAPPINHDLNHLLKILRQKISEIHCFFNSSTHTFGQFLTMHGFQRALLEDDLELLVSRVEAEKTVMSENIETLDNCTNELEICKLLVEKCKVEVANVERLHTNSLKNNGLIQSNLSKIRELRKNAKIDIDVSQDKNCDFWTPTQMEVLDDVSTCQSFSLDDL